MSKPDYKKLEERIKELEKAEAECQRANDILRENKERFRQGEEQLRLTLENTPIGIVTTFRNGRFRTVNTAFCNIIGYSTEELLEMSIKDITHPDYFQQDADNLSKLWSGEISKFRSKKNISAKTGKK